MAWVELELCPWPAWVQYYDAGFYVAVVM